MQILFFYLSDNKLSFNAIHSFCYDNRKLMIATYFSLRMYYYLFNDFYSISKKEYKEKKKFDELIKSLGGIKIAINKND
jgi:hypothetical protein